MAGRKQSRGACEFCGAQYTARSMAKHREECESYLASVEEADVAGDAETILILRVQDAYLKEFWLDLEMRGSVTLKKLDQYLRAIWLECCGHLSQFTLEGWGSSKIGMNRAAHVAFQEAESLLHIYDFGTSSETRVTLLGKRQGHPLSKHPITLLARNLQPEAQCHYCAQKATHLCQGCMYEDDEAGFLCAEHVKGHPHDDYGEPVPLINSPRLGMCGYDGPAEPPY